MSTKTKWLIGFSVAVGSVLIEVIFSFLRGIDFLISGIVYMVVYGTYAYQCLRYIKALRPPLILLAVVAGDLIFQLALRLPYPISEGLLSLPDAVMHFIGMGLGYWFWRARKLVRFVVVLPVAVVVSVGYIYFYDLWLNKLNYDTWTGKVENVDLSRRLMFDTPQGTQISVEDFDGKYLVLDFWNTSCGYCYKAFPQVQELYDSYVADERVEIFAVHCRYDKENRRYGDETAATGAKILVAHGYTFPCLSAMMNDEAVTQAGVKGFPMVLMFSPEGEMIFRGDIEGASKYLKQLLSQSE